MIREVILTTASTAGVPHVAPMGVTATETGYIVQPFRPSRTLDNLLETGAGVVNLTDDARVFAGCVTGRKRDWPVRAADWVRSVRLEGALAHHEIEVERVEDDPERPRLHCRVVHRASHAPFPGLNRAIAAVLEGAILVSRLSMLDQEKIDREMAYLTIAVEKTAGPAEKEAFAWIEEAIAAFRAGKEKA